MIQFLVAAVCLVCYFIILIDAFKAAAWKGVLGLLCVFYMIYYAIFEFKHENKAAIVVTYLVTGLVAGGLSVWRLV